MKRSMLLGGALAVALSACAGASGPTAYEKKAADAASQVVAAARTVLLAARAADDGGAFQQTGAVTIADAESDATAARAAFAAVQPPDPGADQLRAEVLPELERAVDAIGLVRIAAQRGGASLQEVAAPLNALAAGLDQVAWAYG